MKSFLFLSLPLFLPSLIHPFLPPFLPSFLSFCLFYVVFLKFTFMCFLFFYFQFFPVWCRLMMALFMLPESLWFGKCVTPVVLWGFIFLVSSTTPDLYHLLASSFARLPPSFSETINVILLRLSVPRSLSLYTLSNCRAFCVMRYIPEVFKSFQLLLTFLSKHIILLDFYCLLSIYKIPV